MRPRARVPSRSRRGGFAPRRRWPGRGVAGRGHGCPMGRHTILLGYGWPVGAVSRRNNCCTSCTRAARRCCQSRKACACSTVGSSRSWQQERGRIRCHRLGTEQRCRRWRRWVWGWWQRGDRHTGRAKELHLGTVEQPDILRPARGDEARPEHQRAYGTGGGSSRHALAPWVPTRVMPHEACAGRTQHVRGRQNSQT